MCVQLHASLERSLLSGPLNGTHFVSKKYRHSTHSNCYLTYKMETYLEHANITVPSIDAAIDFLQTVDPSFVVRHDETPEGSYRWAHVGTQKSYLALQEPHLDAGENNPRRPYKDHGCNHLAFVVADLDACVARLDAKQYKKSIPAKPHAYRKRAYYFDASGFEWELIQYLTDNVEERNSYVHDNV
jgi:catechol 2,3-dioxygenase-like lactoylglutathione lyase family enzyme